MDQIRVALQAMDPLSEAGLAGMLQSRPEFLLLPAARRTEAAVFVMATDRLTTKVAAMLQRAAAASGASGVLIIDEISEEELFTAVECRVVAVLPQRAVTVERLARSVSAAASSGGVVPRPLVGQLLEHIERLQRDVLTPGLTTSALTTREVDVLRLMADGRDTAEIARQLCYSERTVKNVIYGVTQRLNLRNRSHAVAHALRSGLI